MFDKELVHSILEQIEDALEKVKNRTAHIQNAAFFTDTLEGMENLILYACCLLQSVRVLKT
jgi:hypothetical protein